MIDVKQIEDINRIVDTLDNEGQGNLFHAIKNAKTGVEIDEIVKLFSNDSYYIHENHSIAIDNSLLNKYDKGYKYTKEITWTEPDTYPFTHGSTEKVYGPEESERSEWIENKQRNVRTALEIEKQKVLEIEKQKALELEEQLRLEEREKAEKERDENESRSDWGLF